jgi:hypothetical protein
MRHRAGSIVVGLLLVAGCGSSGSGSAKASGDTSGAKASASVSGAFDSKKCADALAGMGKVMSALPAAAAGSAGDLKTSVAEFDKFAAAAPADIRADVKILASAFHKSATVLAEINFDPSSGKTPTSEQLKKLEQIGSSLDTTETKAASDRVSAWFASKCGKG